MLYLCAISYRVSSVLLRAASGLRKRGNGRYEVTGAYTGSMSEFTQYAALNDLESVVKELSKAAKGPVALVYDPKHGWCLSDEVKLVAGRHGPEEPAYTATGYQSLFKSSIGLAAAAVFEVRFLPGTLIGRLLRKPVEDPFAGARARALGAGRGNGGQQNNRGSG